MPCLYIHIGINGLKSVSIPMMPILVRTGLDKLSHGMSGGASIVLLPLDITVNRFYPKGRLPLRPVTHVNIRPIFAP
jgi:hypothetical protein